MTDHGELRLARQRLSAYYGHLPETKIILDRLAEVEAELEGVTREKDVLWVTWLRVVNECSAAGYVVDAQCLTSLADWLHARLQ